MTAPVQLPSRFPPFLFWVILLGLFSLGVLFHYATGGLGPPWPNPWDVVVVLPWSFFLFLSVMLTLWIGTWADVLMRLVTFHERHGRFQKALRLVRLISGWRRWIFGGLFSGSLAKCLTNQGILAVRVGNYAEAEKALQTAAGLQRRAR